MHKPLRVVAWIFGFLSLLSVSIAEAGKPMLVDLSPDNQRRDVLAPDAFDWRIASAQTMHLESQGIRMALRRSTEQLGPVIGGRLGSIIRQRLFRMELL